MTVLETHDKHPFRSWCDWSAQEESVHLTFWTISYYMLEEWKMQCVDSDPAEHNLDEVVQRVVDDRVVTQSWFDTGDMLNVGINRETHYEDPEYIDEIYEVVVPYERLSPEICEGWIDRLNKQYDKDFELRY